MLITTAPPNIFASTSGAPGTNRSAELSIHFNKSDLEYCLNTPSEDTAGGVT